MFTGWQRQREFPESHIANAAAAQDTVRVKAFSTLFAERNPISAALISKGISVLLLVIFSHSLHGSDPLDRWHWRNPTPTGQELEAITWGAGQFVAVGAGMIAASVDGIEWSVRYRGGEYLRGVVWAGGQFVAVGDNGTILTSTDAITWLSQASGTTGPLRAIAWDGTKYLAFPSVVTSPDGRTWTRPAITGVSIEDFVAMTWHRGEFVGVGSGGRVSSPDGIHWTWQSGGGVSIASNGDRLVAVRSGAVHWDGQQFIMVGAGWDRGFVKTSRDGTTWTDRSSRTTPILYAVGSNGSIYVAAGQEQVVAHSGSVHRGMIYTSADLSTWTQRSSHIPLDLQSVVWSGDLFVAVGSINQYWEFIWNGPPTSTILTSPDGRSWTDRSFRHLPLFSVTYAGGRFVAVGGEVINLPVRKSTIVSSPDGINWTIDWSGSTGPLRAVASNGRLFLALFILWKDQSSPKPFMASVDGVTWAEHGGPPGSWNVATWDGNQFLVMNRQSPATSPDGTNWTRHADLPSSPDSSVWPTSVIKGSERYVAVRGADWRYRREGDVIDSSDAKTWTIRWSGERSLYGVAWGGGQYVVVGDSGTVMSSSDGSTWRMRTPITSHSLYAITWTGKSFLAVGDGGDILESDVFPAEPPRIARFEFKDRNELALEVSTTPSFAYRVEASRDLVDWTTVAKWQSTSATSQVSVADSAAQSETRRFYRVVYP